MLNAVVGYVLPSTRVKTAAAKSYCLEATVHGRTWHFAAPSGDLLGGGCT